ncbi:aminodeoxychorismate synthase component I [Kistimonas scapharcae]|uniref:aminodeoxychorismate synthase n=1 Tax=Kistimonas scapharcae TaxID=1036133 RepID=A0ABP8V7N4_9GAMM
MKHLSITELPHLTDSVQWFERLRSLGNALMLDSVARSSGDYRYRYDILTAAPENLYRHKDGITWCKSSTSDTWQPLATAPFETLHAALPSPVDSQQMPFTGGLAGYWGYELNESLEPGRIKPRRSSHPSMLVGLYLWAVVVDHHTGRTWLVAHPDMSEEKRHRIEQRLHKPATVFSSAFHLNTPFSASMSPSEYQNAFQHIKDWIAAGDCYQVNLTQRFSADYQGDPWSAYLALRSASPTPFAAFLDFEELKVLSHSPERLLRSDNGEVETRPIKGTRPRGRDTDEDIATAAELLTSEKDRAENLMIVDLLRNDLGRNCKPGSIKVPVLFGLESYANVHHLVSTVTGQLAEGHDNLMLLRDAFPGGSITGAPKIRAMEIIRELEPVPRSVYCGAIGYISSHGRMDTNIAIRTLVADGQQIHCWGGGGIVADSDCEMEYQESITKVRNLMNVLENMEAERVAL